MALTFRSDKGAALSINELDNNFRHFTGSHEISGSITLTEGGVSNTLSATDVANLQAGKSIVPTAGARGTITNYAQYDALYNVNDSTTFLDLRTDGVIDFKADNLSAFTITKPTTPGGKDGTISLGRDCFYKTYVKCDLIVERDFQVDGDLHARGDITASGDLTFSSAGSKLLAPNTSASLGNTQVKALKIGNNSVTLAGEDTSYIKTAVITGTDGSIGSDIGQGLYNGSNSTFGKNRIILGGLPDANGGVYLDPNTGINLPAGSMKSSAGTETITGLELNRIRFEVNDVTYLDLVANHIEAYKPIKLVGSGVPSADTDPNLQVLVLKDGVITPGAFVSSLGGEGGGDPNQNAISNITIGDTTLSADAEEDTITFAFGSALEASIDGSTITFNTGSGFTVPLTLDDVTGNGSTTNNSINVGNITTTGVATNALTNQGASTLGGNVTINSGYNLFVASNGGSEGIFLGVTNANGSDGSSFIQDSSANLTIQNYDNDISIVAGANIGIGVSNPDTKITLGQSGDDVKLYATTDDAATNILMLNGNDIVKTTTFSNLISTATIPATSVSGLDPIATDGLPSGVVSGSLQIDELGFLKVVGDNAVSSSVLEVEPSNTQGQLILKVNDVAGSTVTVPLLGEGSTPSFGTLNLTAVVEDGLSDRRPLVIVGNEVKYADADYVTQADLDQVSAEAGSFVLAVSGTNAGVADGDFTANSINQALTFDTTGNGIEIDATTGTRTLTFSLSDGVVSGSAQIASEISGAFNAASASIISDIEGNTTNITTNTTNITTLTGATASYYTADSDVDGANITNNDIIIGAATGTLGDSVTVGAVLNGSGVVSGSGQIDFDSITGTEDVVIGDLDLATISNSQGGIRLTQTVPGGVATEISTVTATGLGIYGQPSFDKVKLTGLSGSNSVRPLVIDILGNVFTGSEYTTAEDVDPYSFTVSASSGTPEPGYVVNNGGLVIYESLNDSLAISITEDHVNFEIGGGVLSSSAQISTDISGAIDAATGSLLSNTTFISGSSQIDFNSIQNTEGLVSGTIAFKNGEGDTVTLLPSQTASFIQTTQGTVFDLEVTSVSDGTQVNLYTPEGIVSGSSQITLSSTDGYGTFSSSFASNIAANESAINTNSSGVSTNATNISNNASSISSINSVTSSFITSIDGAVSSSTFNSPSQGTVRATVNGVDTDVDTGLQIDDSPTFAALTLTGENPITLSPGGLTNNASTVPLVYEAGTGKVYIGDAYSTYTPDSDFTSFVASGSTGGATIGGADTLTIGGNNGITTVGTQNGQNGQITVELDGTFDILNHFSLASPISGAFNAASASIDSSITSLSSSIASDIATNVTDILTNTSNISTNTGNILTNTSNITTNSTDIDALEASASAGIRIESLESIFDAGFSLESYQTASFDAGSGLSLVVDGNDNTVTYSLVDGILSGSGQIASEISGAFNAASASFATLINNNANSIEDNVNTLQDVTGDIIALQNRNAFSTASIVGGGEILSDGPQGQLTFEAGNGIHLSVVNNALVITSSGGGGTSDGYIGNADLHIAGGELDMDGHDISNVNDLEVSSNIRLIGGGGSTGKIGFGNDLTNTFIQANATNTNTEDLELHAQQDLLLRPSNFVGVKVINPEYTLDVGGTIRAQGDDSDVIAGRDVKVERNVVNADHPLTDGIFFSDTLGTDTGGNPATTSNIDLKLNTSYSPSSPNSTSRILLKQRDLIFNDDQGYVTTYFRTPTAVDALRINSGLSGNGYTQDGHVGINTNTITHRLTVRGGNGDNSGQITSATGHSKVLNVSAPGSTLKTEIIFDRLPEADPDTPILNATDIVMIHPSTGQLFTTASEAVGGNNLGVTIAGEVISSNTIALYDTNLSTATFPAMTDPEEGSTNPLQDNYGYLRAEFYGRSGNSIQAARTVFVWDSGSGDNLIATTVEDIRTNAAVTLFDINSVTGSWDGNGNLVMTLQQYNQGGGVSVDYKLRYITI
jgi:ribosomal protein S8E